MSNDFPLPANLPKPFDDGACKHLTGLSLPALNLPSTSGRLISLRELQKLRTVIYCYPMTGVPGKSLPDGWDDIPGARGCTPESYGFRDRYSEIIELGSDVFGLSTQSTEYQREMAQRLHLPFEVLSDAEFKFCDALGLPTFQVDQMRLLRRLTLVIRRRVIETVFYPVYPPDEHANQVIHWLRQNLTD